MSQDGNDRDDMIDSDNDMDDASDDITPIRANNQIKNEINAQDDSDDELIHQELQMEAEQVYEEYKKQVYEEYKDVYDMYDEMMQLVRTESEAKEDQEQEQEQ
eukprot:CAMPEP_0116887400 /NCGR_PEP_ID=MMETSP0463-20121206/21873_1 /TAXON_ID=181622 /ORGANISM="Strombidinopsis sp, Strain SopsisLIS2011" /LENGTH=102 /DNA_ID=CAMNT_0004550029 /DNA_START=458 /DNA_END=766 /DNA_ORIENTATION=+